MEMRWWHLPGPSQFLHAVVQDLRSGKNLVLTFPPHAPDGLREALAEQVRENELWRWRMISATDFPCDGVASLTGALHKQFVPTQQASDLCSVLTLARQLVGTIVWVERAIGQAWHSWQKFLTHYQHACQSCDPCDRSLFCLPVVGNPNPAPLADVALSVRRWEGMVRRLDMTLYLDRMLSLNFTHPLHRKVALAVITELAGSDAHLAQHLAKQELAAIMNPSEVLCHFAASRNWTSGSVRKAAWEAGTTDIVDGTPMLHSAAAVVMGNSAEVTRRVWRGQVTVLYPFIEEQRLKIIPQIRSYLRFPLETTYGRVDDAEDLEVGQLLYFLRGKRVPPRLWRLLNLLTDMRHALAHLEPVSFRSLLADEVVHAE